MTGVYIVLIIAVMSVALEAIDAWANTRNRRPDEDED